MLEYKFARKSTRNNLQPCQNLTKQQYTLLHSHNKSYITALKPDNTARQTKYFPF